MPYVFDENFGDWHAGGPDALFLYIKKRKVAAATTVSGDERSDIADFYPLLNLQQTRAYNVIMLSALVCFIKQNIKVVQYATISLYLLAKKDLPAAILYF